jgi:serine/threonine protein kinase/Tol biopolymer transport system component
MSPERWREVEELFHSAMDREPGVRVTYLAQACGADQELRWEIESLLESDNSALLLDQPAWQAIAELLEGDSALAPGTQLGTYRIDAILGEGGMGRVYKALDTRLNRSIALKISRIEFTDRIEREARAVAALNHPNICTIHDVGPDYLVMELVEGMTLSDRIKAGPVPLDQALSIIRQVGDALETAHERGIVHRDLKPANIKIKPDGGVKVLDFGLATPQTIDAVASKPEILLGTAAYLSPEQACGKPADKRADIWAFGVVLYEMLTGRQLFVGDTISDTIRAVLQQEPDWDRVPAQARVLLRNCLEKDPRLRLRDIGDAWRLLDWPMQPIRRKTGHSIVWVSVTVVVAGVALWALLRSPPLHSDPVSRWTVTLPRPANPSGLGIDVSRDGTRIAYTEQIGRSGRIVVRSLNQPDERAIPGTEGGVRPVFSPDGQWLAYFAGPIGPLRKVSVTAGSPISLCEGAHYTGADWGDDNHIVFATAGGLMRVAAAGGPCEMLISASQGEQPVWPQLLPGNRSVLFTIGANGRFDQARIAVFDLQSRKSKVLLSAGTKARYISSGHLVYARGGVLFAVPFDIKRLAVTGPETVVVDGVFYASGGGFADYAVSSTGLLIYVDPKQEETRTLEWVDRTGKSRPISAPPQAYQTLSLSPDGQRAAVAVSSRMGNNRVFVVDIAQGTANPLVTVPDSQSFGPLWTPDGARIAFSMISAQPRGIYWLPADGSGAPQRLTTVSNMVNLNSWTPDGGMLLFETAAPVHNWKLAVDGRGGEPKRLLEGSGFSDRQGQVSPDGRWLAWTSDESGVNQVYARSLSGASGKTRISAESGQEPRWSRDGRELFYRDPASNQLVVVAVQTSPGLRFGRPKALFTLASEYWDVTPDGKRFVVVKASTIAPAPATMQVVVNWFEELEKKAPARNKQ